MPASIRSVVPSSPILKFLFRILEIRKTLRLWPNPFAQDGRPTPTTFSFQTESPDRDVFHIGGGIVAALPNGIQAFANIEAMLGHDYLDNYVGTIGVRFEL